jgi:hypothetical protein
MARSIRCLLVVSADTLSGTLFKTVLQELKLQ